MAATSDQIVQVTTCTVNAVAVTGVTGFTYSETGTTVSSRGDGELYHTGKFLAAVDVAGSITGINQNSFADIGSGAVGDIVVTGKLVSDGSVITVTIVNCTTTGFDVGQNHSSDGSASLPFEAHSADGSTSPISFAP